MRKKHKLLSLSLLTLFALLIVAAFMIPPNYKYEKQADIIAQKRMVFVFIGELKRWAEWTKWAARDPDMKTEFSDPAWGEGATYRWESFWLADGQIKVTSFAKEGLMTYDLTPDSFEPSHWRIQLTDAPRQGTRVTWTVEGDYPENRFWRLLAYIWNWRLESDIEKSLARLKKHAELHEAYDVFGNWELPTPQPQAPTEPAPPPVKKKSKGKKT